ncbi:PrsW family intramembrane metalloprotease [candidate division KSB1 bacterium]|nr:PrsW family intramembrane metalloprotease [candidate division KSB1 bacterium]
MSLLILVVLGFAPGIFWLWFFYKKDHLEPEPKKLIVQTFFWGMAVALPAAMIEIPFQFSQFFFMVILAPVVEEIFKFCTVRFTVYRSAEFDEPMDGIIYAAAAALGFASIENAAYLIKTYDSTAASSLLPNLIALFFIRALLSVPAHALFSSMWGYALGWAKFSQSPWRGALILKGLFLAMTLHAIFNLLLVTHPLIALGLLVLVFVMWRMVNRRVAASLAASPHRLRPVANELNPAREENEPASNNPTDPTS